MSLHLLQVPQANMLECKLEILLIIPYPYKTYTFEYVAPEGSVQQRTGKWHIFGGIFEKTILHDIWLVDLLANLHKASFILHSLQNFLSKF
jgi:hypothetical protein